MTDRLKRALPDMLIIVVLLIAPLLFFLPQTVGGKTMLPADNLYQWEPYRSMADEAGVDLPPHNALLSDLILENVEWKQFAREEIEAGRIPLWQDGILAGTPFLAAGQSSMLYPFSVLFLIMPVWAAFGWFTVSQLWLAGVWMYLLLRVLGVRRGGGLVGALTYQLSGFMLASSVFPMIIATAAWLPFLLAMVELTIRQAASLKGRAASLPWAALGAMGLGMASLAGHVEALYFTLLVMGFYAAWRLGAEFFARRRDAAHRIATNEQPSDGKPARWLAARAGWLLALVIGGLALGAVQLIPAYELASRSFREGAVSFGQVLEWAYPARRVAALFVPNFYGNPAHQRVLDVFGWEWVRVSANSFGERIASTEWGIKNYVEGAAYAGILPLALAGAAVVQWIVTRVGRARRSPATSRENLGAEGTGRPYRAIFAALGALSLSFAFGTKTYALLYYGLPFINQSHAPFRWVWPFTLCVAVLAGFGVDVLGNKLPLPSASPPDKREDGRENGRSNKRADGRPGGKMAGWMGYGALGLGGLVIGGLAVSRVLYPQVAPLVERVFNGLAKAAYAFPDAQTWYSYEFWNVLILGGMLAGAGLVFLLARQGARWWAGLAAAITAADLMLATWGFFPAADPALLEVTPPSIAWLQDQQAAGDLWRFAVYEEPGADTMNANMGWLHGLQDVAGYDSLIPAQYASYMGMIQPQGDLPFNRIAPLYSQHPDALDSPLLDLLGARYVVTETVIDNPRYTEVYADEAVRIYENEGALPRAFTLPNTSLVISAADDPNEGFRQMATRYDFRQYVVLNVHDAPPFDAVIPEAQPAERGPATVTSFNAQEVWVDAEVTDDSWLLVTGSDFPGWRAWVRPIGAGEDAEREVPIRLANGNFRAVRLEAGRWTVRMKYSPDSFRFGAFASFLTGLGILFALGVWGYRLVYREDPDAAGIQRVAKNTLAPIVLNLFNKGITFVLTFAMLRILGPARAGDYRYAVVIYGWFEILINFGLNTFLTREVARHKDEANRYLVNTTIMRLGLALVGVPALMGFIVARRALVADPLDPAVVWTIGLLYSGLFFSTISTGLTALFYAYEKAEIPAAVQTVSAFLTTALGITALLAGWGIIGLAAVSVSVNLLTFLILGTVAVRQFFRPRPTLDLGLQREALGESFPLMLNHLLATLFFRIDVVLLEALQGSTVVGWYSVVYTWVDAVGIIPSYFTLSLFPVMSRQAVDDRPALKRAYVLAIKLMTMLSVPMAIFTTLLAPFLINVLGGAQYLPHGAVALQIFIWAMVIGWMNSVTQYVIIALDRQRTITLAFMVGAGFNIGANLYFIPRYSYPAAAVITILSEVVLWAIFYVVLMSELGRVNWWRALWRVGAAGLIGGGAALALAGVNMWLALVVGAGLYGGMMLALKPFSEAELERLAPALPKAVRARLMPRVSVTEA